MLKFSTETDILIKTPKLNFYIFQYIVLLYASLRKQILCKIFVHGI